MNLALTFGFGQVSFISGNNPLPPACNGYEQVALLDAATNQIPPNSVGNNPVSVATVQTSVGDGWSASADGQTWTYAYPLSESGIEAYIQITCPNGAVVDSQAFTLYASPPS
jgi:hypothetical protein